MSLFNLNFSRITDSNGRPIAGGLAYFYVTGTTTLQTVYEDNSLLTPHTNPVVADGSGLLPPIYLDDAKTYKVVFKSAAGVTLSTADPVNASNALGSPIDTVSATSYVVLSSDANRIKKRTASGAMTDTLPTAASAGNGCRATIWNATTAYTDTVNVASSGTINGASTFAILPGQQVTFVSDGSAWFAQAAPITTGNHEIPIPAGGLIPRATNGATYAKLETTTNKNNLDTYQFAYASQKNCDFTVQLPPSYSGGAIQAIVEWTDDGTGSSTQTITWGVAGRCLADGDALDQALGTAAEQADALDTSKDYMKSAAFSFTPANAGAGRFLMGTIYRKASTGTYTGVGWLLGLRLLVPINGSTDG